MFAMNAFRSIRDRLGVTQAQMADALGMTQGNVSLYEAKGQTVMPEVAKRLIDYAATLGVELTFDHIYGDAELPAAHCGDSPHTAEAHG